MICKAIRFGIVGAGEGGSRISQRFPLRDYAACVINTGKPDSEKLNLKNSAKLVIDSGINGAGKDVRIGEELFSENQEPIREFLERNLIGKVDYLLITVGGGGGTGTGSIKPLINICEGLELPVGVIYTLPIESEDSETKRNCLRGLKVLNEAAGKRQISPVILIDNQKISENYPNLALTKFWAKANEELAKTFDCLNTLPTKKSVYYSALDSMDYARILSTPGFMTFGKAEVSEYRDKLALADKTTASIATGLMCTGYDLSTSKASGIIFIGSDYVLNRIPAKHIDYVFQAIKENTPHGTIFKGVYRDESMKDKLAVFSVFSGLGLPEQRIEELKNEAHREPEKQAEQFDFGLDSEEQKSQEDPLFELLRKRRTKKF